MNRYETKFPSYPRKHMPWSKTPVVTCTLTPNMHRSVAFRTDQRRRLSLPFHRKFILKTTTIQISGLNTEPAFLIHLASDSPFGGCPQISLLTCWLSFSQAGLSATPRITHWVTITYFIPYRRIPKVSGLSWHDDPTAIRENIDWSHRLDGNKQALKPRAFIEGWYQMIGSVTSFFW